MGFAMELLLKVFCVGMLFFQGTIMNLYLTRLHNYYWWLWYVADILVVCAWSGSLYAAYVRKRSDVPDGRDPTQEPDEIKYSYIVWIVYALMLCPRVILLFKKEARHLEEKDFLGPNFLKVGVACTPLIFLLLVNGHHNSKPFSARKYFIASLGGTITLDLFDSIDLLDFLFLPDERKVPGAAMDATLAFACINFFLPALALSEIRVNRFNGLLPSLPFKLMYEGCYAFLVNVPNLVIRSVLWHKYDMDVSILIMKNVMCIALGGMEIYEYFCGEDHAVKCPCCSNYFQKSYITQHTETCQKNFHDKMPLDPRL
ncbi:transmembrane protein 121B-like [Hydractinia symbiolongicarpus]|uniref:transmembrane protein 121B-like n=1 Tax=Hydractinia symbiolongicarpus TaxID=13093 RepID=UPI002551435B|nr:transmembrane protein 121B-like [Hydractinia symbiolongicarpus]